MANLRTGIDALDAMLFGDALLKGASKGFSPGDVVLIRGEPGAGKTTLAYQIVSNILKDNPLAAVQFVAMEETLDSLERKREAYGFHAGQAGIQWIHKTLVEAWIRRLKKTRRATPSPIISATTAALPGVVGAFTSPVGGAAVAVAAPTAKHVLARLCGDARTLVEQRQDPLRNSVITGQPYIVVIDSLNAFMSVLVAQFEGEDPRRLFNDFCNVIRSHLDGKSASPVILLTGEYHFQDTALERQVPESFFCDIEIVLRTEPVRVPRNQVSSAKFTLGYDVATLLEPEARSVEFRSFCRVPKSRNSPNQSRRCAYDIAPKQGIRFFETYPGDGKLMLFAENEQQRQAWQSFINRDINDAYPALRWELFPMSSIQSVYESTRRLLNVPLRTDMALCSLDSYWIAGYRDYRLKKLVGTRLCAFIDANRDPLTRRARVGCDTLLHHPDPSDPALAARGPSALEGIRTDASKQACIEFPRMVNDTLHFALTALALRLLERTRAHVKSPDGRVRRLEQSMERCREQLRSIETELAENYDGLSQFLFGRKFLGVAYEVVADLSLTDTFLRPLPRSKLSLFGEYDGDVLSSLTREDMHEYRAGEDYWLSIPYDANVGVFVVREELLEALRKPERGQAFAQHFTQLKRREVAVFQRLQERLPSRLVEPRRDALLGHGDDVRRCDTLARAAIADAQYQLDHPNEAWQRFLGDAGARLTWDDVLCLSAISTTDGFGIETRSFDTLIATFLELVWNSGGKLNVNARYEVEDKPTQIIALTRALHYFSAIFELTGASPNDSVDPTQFRPDERYGNWIFARLWYSTLVDALTAQRPEQAGKARDHVWHAKGEGVRLKIIPMPAGLPGKHAPHFTCWGDWNFALLAGSENVELACSLVSNLMGSLKVTDRGLRGAGLPTVKKFYDRYANERCIPQDIRGDMGLPEMTFQELRAQYLEPRDDGTGLKGGIFRQSIFDYRHCAREIYSILLEVKNNADSLDDDAQVERLASGAIKIISRIEDFRNRYMLIRDNFRHDVLRIAEHAPPGGKRKWTRVRVTGSCLLESERASTEAAPVADISAGGCRLMVSPAKLQSVDALLFGQKRIGIRRPVGPDARRARGAGVEFSCVLTAEDFGAVLESLLTSVPMTVGAIDRAP
jgi:RecA/RadA recombinase